MAPFTSRASEGGGEGPGVQVGVGGVLKHLVSVWQRQGNCTFLQPGFYLFHFAPIVNF